MFSSQPVQSPKGLALLEVLIAVSLLTITIVSITSAIVAGQQQSVEARTKIVGAVAAESLLSQLSQVPWETLHSWDGYSEDVGMIVDPSGMPVDGDWATIGRIVSVIDSEIFIEPLEVYILGRTVTVSSFTDSGRVVSRVERFIPEPQS